MVAAPVRVSAAEGLARALERAAGTPASEGNRVTLLIDGPDTYAEMHRHIAAARHRIHLENYIIHDDACGSGFADALIAKAREGVAVRVLYDWFGSWGTGRAFWRRLREGGVDVRAFGPPRWDDPLVLVARDHRKLLVVDGAVGVTGGLCVGDEWVGDLARARRPWRDTAVTVAGPAAVALDAAFAAAWRAAGGAAPQAAEIPEPPVPQGDTVVRVVATEPGRERAYRTIDLLLGVSARRIWVTEAYLAAPQRMYQAFQDAARDGVDVRLLLPGTSDIRVVRNMTRVGYRPLLKAGVRIWEWGGPMLHAKTIVADGRWSRIGSSNLNPSSLLANWEIDLFADDAILAGRMEEQFEADLAQSREVLLHPRRVPTVFGRGIPGRLAWEAPGGGPPAPHVPGSRERRRRAIVSVGGLVRGARAALFGPLALVLLVAAVLFALFPVAMAWGASALTALTGAALVLRASGHRRRG